MRRPGLSGIDVEAAGGKVTFPNFRIGNGYLATFVDGEGNTIGLLEWDEV